MVAPQKLESDLARVAGLGPERAGLSDYHSLVVEDGARLSFSGLAGSDLTRSHDFTLGLLQGPVSLGLGHYRNTSEGFRANGDQNQEISSVLLQAEPLPGTLLQFETRHLEEEFGDLEFLPDPNAAPGTLRTERDGNTRRFGLRQTMGRDDVLLVSLIDQDYREIQEDEPIPGFAIDVNFYQQVTSGELQYLSRFGNVQSITGAGVTRSKDRAQIDTAFTLFPGFVVTNQVIDEGTVEYRDAYQYVDWQMLPELGVLAGLAFNQRTVDETGDREEQWSPKFGLRWTPTPELELRAAGFRSREKPAAAGQTIEPVLFNGFYQRFDSPSRSDDKVGALGASWRLSPAGRFDATYQHRELDYAVEVSTPADNFTIRPDRRIDQIRMQYVHALDASLSLSAGLHYEHKRDSQVDETDDTLIIDQYITDLRTQGVPLGLTWRRGSWEFDFELEYYRQEIEYVSYDPINNVNVDNSSPSEAWVGNAAALYYLPARFGMIELGVQNIGDVRTQVVRPDEVYWQFYPRRFL